MVQWLRLCTANAGDAGWIPGWGTEIPHAKWCSRKTKKSLFPSVSLVYSLVICQLYIENVLPKFQRYIEKFFSTDSSE